MKNYKEIAQYLLKQDPRGEAQLGRVKRQISKIYKIKTVSNITLLKYYREALKRKAIKENKNIEHLLKTREIRTLSGVAPVAVLTKPYPCPGKCSFCPNELDMPKSYLSNEPAVMRAISAKFDPYEQIRARITALKMTGHDTGKIELIIMGGTWSFLPKNYQLTFVQRCFEAMNNQKKQTVNWDNLNKAMKKNEKAKHRCVGLTLETRPDYVNLEEIERMRKLGCTKIELGIQAVDDKILKLNNRGNSVKQIIEATTLLKQAGFKIVYHLMPNLPGSSPAKDVKMYQELFESQNFQPDMVKIYPCVVTKDSEIFKWWQEGKFKPYSNKKLFDTLIKMKLHTPAYVRIIRLIRDIPAESILAGSKVSNLRQDLQAGLKKIEKSCRCIRCREIKNFDFKNKDIKLKKITYQASCGEEYFLSYEDIKQDKLLAFLRLRLSSNQELGIKNQDIFFKTFPELKGCALIREIHTYGATTQIKTGSGKKVQHRGFGKNLIAQAEKIAQKKGYKKIAVISAIGTRGYYKKWGYKLVGTYMVKSL
jgi:elongator complex protein 3